MILVVGDSCALGQAMLEQLRAKGIPCTGVSRHSGHIAADLFTDAGLARLGQELDRLGPLSGVVQFVGGMTGDGRPLEVADADWENTFSLNVLSTVRLARLLESRLAPGACWLNISSAMVRSPSLFNAHYAAAKAALESVSRSLALQWAERRIRVLTVRLGAVDTEKARQNPHFDHARVAGKIALGRLASPAEVAKFLALLLSPDAAWNTGHVIDFDGGTGLR